MTDPVVQIIEDATGEVAYTLRIKGAEFRPKVLKEGTYTIRVDEPRTDKMRTYKMVPAHTAQQPAIVVQF
jgi:hypothetical protein